MWTIMKRKHDADCLLAAKCNSAIKLCLLETCPYVHTYTLINKPAFYRTQIVINHSYDSNKWGTFPKVQGVFWPQQWGKMDSEVRRISLYACIDCQSQQLVVDVRSIR